MDDDEGTRLTWARGDLTAQEVDVVVNAANGQLAHGGGVALAIARAAGPTFEAASRDWVRRNGPLGPGQAATTTGGDLPARHVVHVVGPVFRDGQDNPGLLAQAVGAALDAASTAGGRTVALPAISAGIYGYPVREAAAVIAEACRDWIAAHPEALEEVRLVAYDEAAAVAFRDALGG